MILTYQLLLIPKCLKPVNYHLIKRKVLVLLFTKAVIPLSDALSRDSDILNILTSDDLMIETSSDYDYYGYNEHEKADIYDSIYQAKITEMDAKKKVA